MKTSELDYDLPAELIAQQALSQRDHSRLMILDRTARTIRHGRFSDLQDYLNRGDCLVVNNTAVVPARFFLRRATGGRIEGLFLNHTDAGLWEVLLKGASRLKIDEVVGTTPAPGGAVAAENAFSFRTHARYDQGRWLLEPLFDQDYVAVLRAVGITPLPPYIHRSDSSHDIDERDHYQTVYACHPGSAAAPTAGLHFTPERMAALQASGIMTAQLTLHVGLGTFRPVSADRMEDHPMHAERFSLQADSGRGHQHRPAPAGGRIIAVGTTSVRTLETLADRQTGDVSAGTGQTDIYILPGYEFSCVQGMITNFHLPRSTLLALVCAFAGTDFVMGAYAQAVQMRYRFFSYGDAMLIV